MVLLEGSLDLGLINVLVGDDLPHDLDATRLLHGNVVIVMRAGYLMHRFVHRPFDERMPSISYSTDGAEMAS